MKPACDPHPDRKASPGLDPDPDPTRLTCSFAPPAAGHHTSVVAGPMTHAQTLAGDVAIPAVSEHSVTPTGDVPIASS